MNLIHGFVKSVISKNPYKKYDKWWVSVTFTAHSDRIGSTVLMFNTLEDALKVKVGYKFLH
jgi:hypothetical protein